MADERPDEYHTLDGIEQLLADAMIDGFGDAEDSLDTQRGGRDPLTYYATIFARALGQLEIMQVAAEANVSTIDDLLIISVDEWRQLQEQVAIIGQYQDLNAAERTAYDALFEALPDMARRLSVHGLLHTYAPHHNPGEDTRFTRPGAERRSWYHTHNFTDPKD